MKYLDRLKRHAISEKPPYGGLTKLTKAPSVSFDSDQGRPFLKIEAANEPPTPEADRLLLWWRVAAAGPKGERIEHDWPSGITLSEAERLFKKWYGWDYEAQPLIVLKAGPYRVTHADGWTWTMQPLYGLPMSREAVMAEARRATSDAHGEVVNVEEVKQ